MTGDATSEAESTSVEAVDQAVARLATDVGRLDAIDLDAPWDASQRSRRDHVVGLVARLEPGSVPDDTSHGWPLAAALGAAWAQRRDALLGQEPAEASRGIDEILATIHDVHVRLDVGVHPHDLPGADPEV